MIKHARVSELHDFSSLLIFSLGRKAAIRAPNSYKTTIEIKTSRPLDFSRSPKTIMLGITSLLCEPPPISLKSRNLTRKLFIRVAFKVLVRKIIKGKLFPLEIPFVYCQRLYITFFIFAFLRLLNIIQLP